MHCVNSTYSNGISAFRSTNDKRRTPKVGSVRRVYGGLQLVGRPLLHNQHNSKHDCWIFHIFRDTNTEVLKYGRRYLCGGDDVVRRVVLATIENK